MLASPGSMENESCCSYSFRVGALVVPLQLEFLIVAGSSGLG